VPTVTTYIIDVVEDEDGGTATFAHEDERTLEGIFARGADGSEAFNRLLARLRVTNRDDVSVVSPSAPEPSETAVPAGDLIEAFRLAAGSDAEFWFSYRALDGAVTQRRVRALAPAVVERGLQWQLNAFDLDKEAPRNFTIAGITDVVKVA
jgi:predicted DNA-binding transcriptional regulator YafY